MNEGINNNFEASFNQSERTLFQERQKETLPTVEVKNIALWVNPAFQGELPFTLEKGQPSDLGVFLTPYPELCDKTEIKESVVMPEKVSGRAVLLGEFTVTDMDGISYRDIDLQGTGVFLKMPDGHYSVGEVRKRLSGWGKAKGLIDYTEASKRVDNTELFIKLGIRTYRIISVLELGEIIDTNGQKISVREAKQRNIIDKDMQPVIAVRAFGTKERIDYLDNTSSEDEKKRASAALEDAKNLVAKEFHKNPSHFSTGQYLEWFASTLGLQIAKMRNEGLFYGYLHSQNITLDCRIVDLEAVRKTSKISKDRDTDLVENIGEDLTTENLYQSEFDAAKKSFEVLLNSTLSLTKENIENNDFYFSLYKKAYEEGLKQVQE
jgi:hypothetical protein